jgi:hypothetical protein
MRVTAQILEYSEQHPARILHSFAHSAPSLRIVKESLRAVFFSDAWPKHADAFRVLSEDGRELYCWPGTTRDLLPPARALAVA